MRPFKLEEFWKKYEFNTPYLLCCSDAESWSLSELLALADEEALTLWNQQTFHYTEVQGLPLLRQEIAKLYETVDAERIGTFAGAEEGIYSLMKTLVQGGDHVIVIDPCYQSLAEVPLSAGAELTRIALDPQQGWRLDLAQIQAALRSDTKLIVLNYPHNPSGALPTRAQFEQLIALARSAHAYLFNDEVYRYLELDEADRLPSVADAYEKGISLNVMTKSFGLAGLRIGWLASQDAAVIEAACNYKLYLSICNSAPSEILALMGLRAREQIWRRNRAILQSNAALLDAFMQRHAALFSWTRPRAGTSAAIRLHMPLPVEAFVEQLVQDAGILLMPGSVFDLEGNYFRLGLGRKDFPSLLARFEEALQSSHQQTR